MAVPLAAGHRRKEEPANAGASGRPVATAVGRRGQHTIANRATGPVLDGGDRVASGSVTKQWNWDGSTILQWTFSAQAAAH